MNFDNLTDEEVARYCSAAVFQAECEDSCVNTETVRQLVERFCIVMQRNEAAVLMLTGEKYE